MGKFKGKIEERDLDKVMEILKDSVKNNKIFFLAVQATEGTMVAGGEPEKTSEFLAQIMEYDEDIADTIMSASSIYLWKRLRGKICPGCDDKQECDGFKNSCVPAGNLESRLRVLKMLNGIKEN